MWFCFILTPHGQIMFITLYCSTSNRHLHPPPSVSICVHLADVSFSQSNRKDYHYVIAIRRCCPRFYSRNHGRQHQFSRNGWAMAGAFYFPIPPTFTPVCTTELGAMANIKDEFDKRGVKVLAISVDPLESHEGWISDINETQNATVNYPMNRRPRPPSSRPLRK